MTISPLIIQQLSRPPAAVEDEETPVTYRCQTIGCNGTALYGRQYCERCREEIEGQTVEWDWFTSLYVWGLVVGGLLLLGSQMGVGR